MHNIEPYYAWRDYYISSDDEDSPFYGREYDEFSFRNSIYNYFIHPQWDFIESETLYLKIIYCNYEQQIAIIEFIGEWNDALHNDIETLLIQVIQHLMDKNIIKFVLIGENVLNFHGSDDEYYADWYNNISDENGWIVALNFQEHVIKEMKKYKLDHHIIFNIKLNKSNWRKYKPNDILLWIENEIFNTNLRIK